MTTESGLSAEPDLAPDLAPDLVAEQDLAADVLDALLRENFAGLSHRVDPGGPALLLPGRPALPLEPDGFLTDLKLRRPVRLTLADVDSALRALADPADAAGIDDFADECRQALAGLHLRQHEASRLARHPSGHLAARRGLDGQLGYDALAATQPHPAYPTAAARLGFTDADALAYAPEWRPEFALRWVAIPRAALTRAGHLPSWWPRPSDVGLPAALDAAHDLLPVHPLTAGHALAEALASTGLPAAQLIAPGTHLKVTPTLSTRTVAVKSQPGVHLKLPLPTSTLGRLDRHSIVPGTLPDGALVRAVLAEAACASPPLQDLLLADESHYAHAGHPFLGYLMRQLPDGLNRCHIVPLAALLAPAPDGRALVIEELARQHGDGTVTGLFQAYLDVLFGIHVDLFVCFGITLESHQQNAALVLDPDEPDDPLRLLIKDFDGALIHYGRLAAGPIPVPEPEDFADPRLLTSSDDALADVFITITVHLCAGALAFGLARHDQAPRPVLLDLIRQSLIRALGRYPGHPAAELLRARVLTADRLPGKTMLTAGTLMTKARSGASDINKHYGTTGPNYLKAPVMTGSTP
ncbi:MAG TPA: IucA/IucC family protein [Streptosporangiaceae bacterium]|jgi:siderophore synthetase component